MEIPWHVLRGLGLGTDPGQGAASVSIPAAVTYGLTGSGDNNGIASNIADGRRVTSVQDKASPLVFCEELLDWLADLGMDVYSFMARYEVKREWFIKLWL